MVNEISKIFYEVIKNCKSNVTDLVDKILSPNSERKGLESKLNEFKESFFNGLREEDIEPAREVLNILSKYNLNVCFDKSSKPPKQYGDIDLKVIGEKKLCDLYHLSLDLMYFAALDELTTLGADIEFDKEYSFYSPGSYGGSSGVEAKAIVRYEGCVFDIYLNNSQKPEVKRDHILYLEKPDRTREVLKHIDIKYHQRYKEGIYALYRKEFEKRYDNQKEIRRASTEPLFNSYTIPTRKKYMKTIMGQNN